MVIKWNDEYKKNFPDNQVPVSEKDNEEWEREKKETSKPTKK
jgi:hypothetical protein